MVQSKVATVDGWMEGVAASDRPLLEKLRSTCR
jgi:hypothetical protein